MLKENFRRRKLLQIDRKFANPRNFLDAKLSDSTIIRIEVSQD